MNRVHGKMRSIPVGPGTAIVRWANRELLPKLHDLLALFNLRTGRIYAVTADYDVPNDARGVVVNATGGAVTITLSDAPETAPWVMKSDASGNAVTIAAPAGTTLVGTSSITTQYDVLQYDFNEETDIYYRTGST